MDYEIAILGNEETILGFKALGVKAYPVESEEDAIASLDKIMDKQATAVLFITEDWAVKLGKRLDQYRESALPALITIPSQKGSSGMGLDNIKKIVERAVGSDILSNN